MVTATYMEVLDQRVFFFFQAEDGIRDYKVTGVQTCALPISGVQLHDRIHLIARLRPSPDSVESTNNCRPVLQSIRRKHACSCGCAEASQRATTDRKSVV